MTALAQRIETEAEAGRLADIGPAWCVVARQSLVAGTTRLVWTWTLPTPEAKRLISARDEGTIQTVIGREAGECVLYARRPRTLAPERMPPPEAPDLPETEPVVLALGLLRLIAEDPLVRASYRTAARRHLARLAPPPPG